MRITDEELVRWLTARIEECESDAARARSEAAVAHATAVAYRDVLRTMGVAAGPEGGRYALKFRCQGCGQVITGAEADDHKNRHGLVIQETP